MSKLPEINVSFNSPLLPALCLSRREAGDIAGRLLNHLGMKDSRVNLIFAADPEMERLNRKFLLRNGPTNVLAFPEPSERSDSNFLGEVYIGVQALQREALLYGQSRFEHFIRLLGHGLLHLAGYTHGPEMYALNSELPQIIDPEDYGLKSNEPGLYSKDKHA